MKKPCFPRSDSKGGHTLLRIVLWFLWEPSAEGTLMSSSPGLSYTVTVSQPFPWTHQFPPWVCRVFIPAPSTQGCYRSRRLLWNMPLYKKNIMNVKNSKFFCSAFSEQPRKEFEGVHLSAWTLIWHEPTDHRQQQDLLLGRRVWVLSHPVWKQLDQRHRRETNAAIPHGLLSIRSPTTQWLWASLTSSC